MIANADRLVELEKQQVTILEILESMEESYSMARQVVALRDDRLKKELSILVVEYLRKDNPAGASEHMARADARYSESASRIMDETAKAQQIVTHWDVLRTKFESTQALLNNERAKMKML